MDSQKINRISGSLPVGMSLVAFAVVLIAVSTGRGQGGTTDEGAGAHIFQLLIVAQIPCVLVFLATADWQRATQVIKSIAFQTAALILALGSLVFFKL